MTKHPSRNRSNSPGFRGRQHDNQGAAGWLWGQHAVAAALANPRRQLRRLVATRNGRQRLGAFADKAEDIAPPALDALLPLGAVHQGLAAQFEPLEPCQIEDLIAAGLNRVAVLDQVSDPHNLGAIFRSAAAFGVGAIILQTRNAPPITGTVAKTAAGAIETVRECRAVNLARAIEQLGEAGYHTIGMAGEGRARIDRAIAGATRVAIVLGAEGSGLRPGVAKACAEIAHIPMQPGMESLNVSNAAAIAFYEAARLATPVA